MKRHISHTVIKTLSGATTAAAVCAHICLILSVYARHITAFCPSGGYLFNCVCCVSAVVECEHVCVRVCF